MKILILKNKIKTSIKQLKDVKDFFKNVEDIQFTEEYVNYDFPNGEYSYYDLQGKLQYYKAVDETWYDEYISKPSKARGFDCVIFLIKPKYWVASFIDGFGTSTPDWGIEEIAVKYYTSGTFNFMGVKLKGNKLYWILVHEILHRLYNIRKLEDNTHKYFLEKTPEKCLEDFKEEIMPIALLKRTESNNKQTLGNLTISYQGKTFNCKVLELSWKNNQKNISCIPKGLYKVKPHYSEKFGKVYWVQDVDNRSYIYFHVGNYYKDTLGCLLVGDSYSDINKDGYLDVINSRKTLDKMLKFLDNKEFLLSIV